MKEEKEDKPVYKEKKVEIVREIKFEMPEE